MESTCVDFQYLVDSRGDGREKLKFKLNHYPKRYFIAKNSRQVLESKLVGGAHRRYLRVCSTNIHPYTTPHKNPVAPGSDYEAPSFFR